MRRSDEQALKQIRLALEREARRRGVALPDRISLPGLRCRCIRGHCAICGAHACDLHLPPQPQPPPPRRELSPLEWWLERWEPKL